MDNGLGRKYCVITKADNGYIVNTFIPATKTLVHLNMEIFDNFNEMVKSMQESTPGDEWKGGGNFEDFKEKASAIVEEGNKEIMPIFGTHIFINLPDAMSFMEKFIG